MEDDIFTLARDRGAVSAVSVRAVSYWVAASKLMSFALIVRAGRWLNLVAVLCIQ